MENDDGPVRFVHDTSFTEAFSNTDHKVFGKRLAPFCLWHQLNLEIEQAKVMTGEAMTPLDLWIAVRICTTPWSPYFRHPDVSTPSLVRFLWQVGRYNFRHEVAKFSKYLIDYTSRPHFWPNQHEQHEGSGDRDIDETLELALHLMKEGGFTWEQVWTMPTGMARWASAGLSKLAGNKVDIWTPEHEARFQEHKKTREARIDARGREIALAEQIDYPTARERAKKEHWARVSDQQAYANAQSKYPR